jgi:hypothetical protein
MYDPPSFLGRTAMLTAFWTWLLSKLFNIKTLAFLIVLAALVYGGWKGYDWILQRGVTQGISQQKKADDKQISTLTAQVTQDKKDIAAAQTAEAKAKADLATYVSTYNTYVAETKANQDKLNQQQQQVLKQLNGTIASLQNQLKQAQTGLTNDIPTFIPPDGSTACQLPRGLILLYNASLTGTDSSGGFSTSLSLETDAFDASGVSCSTFAGYLVDNGLAAYSNRQLLIQWITWYNDNKALIDAAIAAEQATPTPVTSTTSTKAAPTVTTPTSGTSTKSSTTTNPASTNATAPVH